MFSNIRTIRGFDIHEITEMTVIKHQDAYAREVRVQSTLPSNSIVSQWELKLSMMQVSDRFKFRIGDCIAIQQKDQSLNGIAIEIEEDKIIMERVLVYPDGKFPFIRFDTHEVKISESLNISCK